MSPGPPKQFDRDEALEKALHTFWELGYRGTSMRDLIESMGIGRQSLYDTFGDKHELFLESLRRYIELSLDPMIAVLSQPGSPLGNVHALLDMWEGYSQTCKPKGCLAMMASSEMAQEDGEVRDLILGCLRRFESALATCFEKARGAGELSMDIEPVDFARLMLSASRGVAVLDHLQPGPDQTLSVLRTLRALLGPRPA